MENFDDKQLGFAYWLVNNKEKLKKIGLILFIIVDSLMVAYGLWGFVDYYVISNQDKNLWQGSLISRSTRPQGDLKQLEILDTAVLASGLGKYDLVVKVKNSNNNFAIPSMKYHFLLDNGETTEVRDSFILANQEKYLMLLAYPSQKRINQATIQFDEINWQRLDKIANYKPIEIIVSDKQLTAVTGLENSSANLQSLSFKAKNNSLYDLWEVGFQIVFIGSQNKTVGANYLKISDLTAGQTKKIEIYLPLIPLNYRDYVIFPEVNIFDEGNIKKPPVEIKSDRTE